MAEESKIWKKFLGEKIASEKLSLEGFNDKIPFDIYDGYAYCEDFKGHRYEMTYPQIKAIRDSKEMADAIIEYINSISTKKIETANEISVLHILTTFNTLYCDGVEIVPKG